MPANPYMVNQRIKYRVYFSTPFGSIGSTWLPGKVVAVAGTSVTTQYTDPNLKPA